MRIHGSVWLLVGFLLHYAVIRAAAETRFYDFNVSYTNYTVNCQSKSTPLVNGQFPGPIIHASEGDRVVVKVTNNLNTNVTIHWHGVLQLLQGWQDGVAYITQCPLQAGDSFTYNFTVVGQQGTLLWHAHVNWLRATVHGAFIIYPKEKAPGYSYPFPVPRAEFPIVVAEWWNNDVEQVEASGLLKGGAFQTADALTINGHPGALYNCSAEEGITTFRVTKGQTYMLRIINAALNTEIYFSIANHSLTVVEADGEFLSPFSTDVLHLTPGQTTNVLVKAKETTGNYLLAVTGYTTLRTPDFPKLKGTAVFQYAMAPSVANYTSLPLPPFPATNDTGFVAAFASSLKSLYPGQVPLTVDRNLYFTFGLSSRFCVAPQNCTFRTSGAVNNITFQTPTIALLQAKYYGIPGVFTEDFPDNPPFSFDYTYATSPPPALMLSQTATRLSPMNFSQTVQVVLQDTMFHGFEDHPFHLHGHSFFIVGRGFGNYNSDRDPTGFNLYDPPLRNTVGVPARGWAAIRFTTNNPGIWLFHCHLDKHTSWGMMGTFSVNNGVGPNETLPAPPPSLSPC